MNIKRLFFFTGNTILLVLLAAFFKMVILTKMLGQVFINSNGIFSIVMVKNNGAAFNILAGYHQILVIFAVIIVVFCMLYCLLYKLYISDRFLMLMSIFCAGIIGNAYERISYGYVIDYLKFNLLNFPVFNLYDVMITCGAISIALVLICDKRREIQEIKDVEEDDLYRELL